MRIILSILLSGILVNSALADLCSVIPEAKSKKDTLPVKYKKLAKENEELKAKLENCQEEKERIKENISNLKSQISQLEEEKANLQNKLMVLPSKEDLESQIQQLESKMGR
jgi:predicted  nucleic acid-binding Zn-ribbon protein